MDQALAHIPGLRRYARLLTGDGVRADDLVQDTLERACRKWSLWRPGPGGTGLRGWLLSLMHNLYLNQVRDHGREWQHEELSEALEPAHDPFAHAAERLDLERALQHLGPMQREVLLLVAVEDMTYAETAAVLGVPVGTVMSRLSRAREDLRQRMAGEAATPQPVSLKVVR
jgi:RNA polymerase sigma factor (sigma-70 family)